MEPSLPRYFVPRDAGPAPAPAPRGPLLTRLVDAFRLGGRGRSQREVAVALDRSGALHLIEDLRSLPPPLRAELSRRELSGGALRLLDAEQLWLFAIQMLEQPGDAPGIDDPVYLYGRLFGPLPSAGPVTARGQLALTRSDLLEGLVGSARDGLALDGGGRCLHAALAGDRAEEIEAGRALILGYPLAPAELGGADASNEELGIQLLYDLLSATRSDARRSGIPHPLLDRELPVPSRADLEGELEAQGWEIQGDVAIRRTPATAKGTIGGLLSQVLGVPEGMRRALPPEATLEGLLQIAAEALPAFPGFPSRRVTALRARTLRGAAPAPPSAPAAPRIPRASAPRPPDKNPPPRSPDWMDDFVSRHGPKPKLTRMEPRAEPPAADWMKDFEDS